jgi:hypothetical protein
MKKSILLLIALNLFIWVPILMGAWDKDKPSASTSLRDSNPEILANFSALESVIGQDHEFSTGGTNSGKHTQVTFDDPLSSAPSSVSASEGVLYLLDVSSKAELHFEDEDEHTLQLTSGGNLYSSTNLEVAGTSTFTGAVTANGGITLGAGDDLIGSSTSDITFNTDKFTVAGATGNTVIAGTCDITGVLTTTAASVLGDGSTLAAATEAGDGDRTIADKAYADAAPAAQMTPTSYAGEESVTFPNGLVMKMGYTARSGNQTTVTFGTAFPTSLLCFTATVVKSNPSNMSVEAVIDSRFDTTSSVIIYTSSGTHVDGFYWIATGY